MSDSQSEALSNLRNDSQLPHAKLIIPQPTSIAWANKQLDLRRSQQTYHSPNQLH